ncbi:MAG: hypothetical protein QJR12_01335 [Mycobacterium sp.]|uniref:hypothetical protein n=1 Tax=Mycobacterium sp. TaxID=1785 RepID=UPI00261685CB|nr:hypothetical protein [Mycobacterium sp.]MDI3312958.1 hypothetical protein [Mycobacterium sp.]
MGPVAVVTVGLSPALAPPAKADVFVPCPDGLEGVVGGHTTCEFAENVRAAFFACGGCHHFPAYSPVTGELYEMDCEGLYRAYMADGEVLTSTHCYAGENAEVVIW